MEAALNVERGEGAPALGSSYKLAQRTGERGEGGLLWRRWHGTKLGTAGGGDDSLKPVRRESYGGGSGAELLALFAPSLSAGGAGLALGSRE